MTLSLRPVWAEVDLDAVAHNVHALRALVAPASVLAVVKADAYGHGALPVARAAIDAGAAMLGVALVEEGVALRHGGVQAPVLVLSEPVAAAADAVVEHRLVPAVYTAEGIDALGAAAARASVRLAVHLKVDTGMHRLGVAADAAAAFTRWAAGLDGVVVSGIFTHFACADDPSPAGVAATDAQLSAFAAVLADLEATGDRPPTVHAANSAAVLARPDAGFDLVRPGIAVYGLPPGPEVPVDDLRPVLTWRSQVAQVHELGPDEGVGYGHTWRTARPSRVATVPVGYADGLRRAPATWRHVLVRGACAPLVGRVSMDQISIDVTDVPGVRRGDEVVLLGRQGNEELSAAAVADWLGTSCYEVVAEILARVPRIS